MICGLVRVFVNTLTNFNAAKNAAREGRGTGCSRSGVMSALE